jgi:hypothetical protein
MCELNEDDGKSVEILVPNAILVLVFVVTFLLTGLVRWGSMG